MRKGWDHEQDDVRKSLAHRTVWPWELLVLDGDEPGTFAYRVQNVRNAEPLYEQSDCSQELSLPTEDVAMEAAEEQLQRVLVDALWVLEHAPRDGERPLG